MSANRSRRYVVHPRRRALLAWLDEDGVIERQRLTAHLGSCERCADRLAALVSAETPAAGSRATGPGVDPPGSSGSVGSSAVASVATAIRESWTVPSGLPARIVESIDRRRQASQELDLLLGLFTIGADTAELLLPGGEVRGVDDEEDASR